MAVACLERIEIWFESREHLIEHKPVLLIDETLNFELLVFQHKSLALELVLECYLGFNKPHWSPKCFRQQEVIEFKSDKVLLSDKVLGWPINYQY